MATQLNILGWVILWGIGLAVVPLLAGVVSTFITDGDESIADYTFVVALILYLIGTAISLILI